MRGARVLALLALACGISRGYAVLAHEAVIDATWDDAIQPLLLARFPQSTPDNLRQARAYAYGGCIIQDMGYYPFGNGFLSELIHYVRTGDFVAELIKQSQDVKEYAFALGALAHYVADSLGHPMAVNSSVALLYPKLRHKYGPLVTYEDNKPAHLRVEFGFDVIEVAGGHYAPKAYHDFIGFEVAQRLLEVSLRSVYGLEMNQVFRNVDLAIGTYRFSVRAVIPEATKVAWALDRNEIRQAEPGMTRARFRYSLTRSHFERHWGREYRRPGIGARILALLFRVLPKVGPLSGFAFRPPTPHAQTMFLASFNTVVARYRALLSDVKARRMRLANVNLDTGRPIEPGEYRLADEAHARLARTLAESHFTAADESLRKVLLGFFADSAKPIATRRHKRRWRDTMRALDELRGAAQAPDRELEKAERNPASVR